jgi:leucine dehydrogenase
MTKSNLNMHKSTKILAKMDELEHEQVVFCQDKETGLKAIIAIHDSTLGPALGGTRMWNYDCEEDALNDVLRLSRGMSFKAAISGIALGGGKAVIIGDASVDKTEKLMRRFGKFVDTLAGKYITAEDVGMNTKDMEYVMMETKHVTGTPQSMGGSGDPSPVTAYGVYMGMKASAQFLWGSDKLDGKRVLVQGVGHVGEYLVKYLSDEDADVFISDIDQDKLNTVSEKYNAEIIENNNILDFNMDIYAPCALGAILNTQSIDKLKCSIVCGGANNQLEFEERDSLHLKRRNIVFAPDFLVNSGGLINVYSEIKGYSREKSLEQTKNIYKTTLDILNKSRDEGITSYSAALNIAKKRIADKKNN